MGRSKIYNYPNELICTITGKPVKTNPTQLTAQLAKTGKTIEEYIKTFVSREGKRALKEKSDVINKEPTKTPSTDEKYRNQITPINQERLDIIRKVFPKVSKSTPEMLYGDGRCHNQMYFLDNGRRCKGCEFVSICTCHLKKI